MTRQYKRRKYPCYHRKIRRSICRKRRMAWHVLSEAVYQYQKKTVRKMILKDHKRPDGRAITQIRPLAAETDISSARTWFCNVYTWTDTDLYHHNLSSAYQKRRRLDGLDEFETSKALHASL